MGAVPFPENSRDNSVGIETGYGMDGRGSMPGRGKTFLFCIESRTAMGPTQPLIRLVSGTVSPGVKRQSMQIQYIFLGDAAFSLLFGEPVSINY
jgi:hypothetical protein